MSLVHRKNDRPVIFPVALALIVRGFIVCAPFFACDLPAADPAKFLDEHCAKCHDADTKKGGLDLSALKPDYSDADIFAK